MADTIKKLQSLITAANATTGKSDTDMTTATQSLIAGFGGGGESVLPHFTIESVQEIVHEEDWLDDSKGNTANFVETYIGVNKDTGRRLHLCYISNNTAPLNYRANYLMAQCYVIKPVSANAYQSVDARANFTNWSFTASPNRSFYISKGAKITIIKIYPEEVK